MFTLRKVFPDGSISNTYIGDYYMIVKQGSQKFTELLEKVSKDGDIVEGAIFAFIITRGQCEIHSLDEKFDYYIVNEHGATFERQYKR